MTTKLSANFTREELQCPHCASCQIKGSFLVLLEEFRTAVGTPLKVLSGYRCPAHNKSIGGEQGSKHCDGIAADIQCPAGVPLVKFYTIADKIFHSGGIGVYAKGQGQNTDFLHVDDRGSRARWSRVNGKYLGVDRGLSLSKPVKGQA